MFKFGVMWRDASCIVSNKIKENQHSLKICKIVPYLYGEHDKCGAWCRSEKSGYKPRNLPYGKPLTDQLLRVALEDLFKVYVGKVEELATLRSTQTNDNFNHMVASKTPKRM